MSRLFLRSCSLSVSGMTINGGGSTDLRIEFLIGSSTIQSPDPARFRIYNPNPQTITAFQQAAKSNATITFSAGYQDNVGHLYSGDVKQSLYAHESPVDAYIDIFCAAGQNAYQKSTVTKTLSAGWTPQDKVNVALQSMQQYGITGLGIVNVDLSQPSYPRGRPFVGMARDLIRQVAFSADATWDIQDGKVNIVNHDKPIPSSGPITLNSQTGLIGWPQQTENGIIARCLINPALRVHSQVQINESAINPAERNNNPHEGDASQQNFNIDSTGQIAADGVYNILFIETSGDTRGQDWYQTLTLLATAASPTQSQAEAGGNNISDVGDL